MYDQNIPKSDKFSHKAGVTLHTTNSLARKSRNTIDSNSLNWLSIGNSNFLLSSTYYNGTFGPAAVFFSHNFDKLILVVHNNSRVTIVTV